MDLKEPEKEAIDAAKKAGTKIKSNRYFNPATMAHDKDATILPKIEKTLDNDLQILKNARQDMKSGTSLGDATRGVWAGMVENSGGSKIKAVSRLGAYAAGIAAVADLLNPLSPGWGD